MNRRRPNPGKMGFKRVGMASYEICHHGRAFTVRRFSRTEFLIAPSDLLKPGARVGLTHSERTLTDALACARFLIGL